MESKVHVVATRQFKKHDGKYAVSTGIADGLLPQGAKPLTLYVLIFQREHKHIFTFYVLTPY